MFTGERLERMIKDAKMVVEVREETLLKSTITAQFNPTEYNISDRDSDIVRLAEGRNVVEKLTAMLEGRYPMKDVTPEDVKNQFAQLVA